MKSVEQISSKKIFCYKKHFSAQPCLGVSQKQKIWTDAHSLKSIGPIFSDLVKARISYQCPKA